MSQSLIPAHAQTIIIGGGIVGCSLAYHLARNGRKDVLLIEQGQLSCGTTWHAAGLVGQLRSQSSLTRLIRYSTDLYSRLEAETGLATGWKQCGSMTIARTDERMTVLRRSVASARAQGVDIEEMSPREAGDRWPLMRNDDLKGAVWLPGDGKANPADITQALARGARQGGARIVERVRVTGFETAGNRMTAVITDHGRIACEEVAITAGQWSRAVGLMAGVAVPLHSAEHMYIVTGKVAGVTPDLPVMRDPDGYIYFKEEVGGLVMGGFEPDAKPWGMTGIPEKFEFQLLPDDWDQFQILMEHALQRVPALETAEIKTFLNGPESFTPDNNFILGRAPERDNVFIGAGFNSMGIASAGGAGRALAEWMIGGEPSLDLWAVDPRRFAPFNNNPAWLHDRVKETLGLHYAMPWPNRELTTARPFRRSPLYDRLAARGAVFGSKMGWERANWFAPEGVERDTRYSFGRQNWFETVGTEHRACRTGVALFDMTSFGKIQVEGPDAVAWLQHLCANDIDVEIGRTVYTPMLNERGGFESDLTVARLGENRFLLVTGSGQIIRDLDWIGRKRPATATRASASDVTGAYAVLAVMGPHARTLMTRISADDWSAAGFAFGTIRTVSIGHATCLASRRSYMGEMGWELYVPVEFAAMVYDTLHTAGASLGIMDAGYYAVDSLRIEKGYRAWGRELTPDVTPYEAGLGFAVAQDKQANFLGKAALAGAAARPPMQRIVSLVAREAETPVAWGGELILADGVPAGEVTSASYGYSLGALAGLGMVRRTDGPVDAAWLASRSFAIDIAGVNVPVSVSLTPFHDPANRALRG